MEMITEDLIIRKARKDDLQAIWNNVWRDERIARWMYWCITASLSDAIDRLERTIRYQSSHDAFFICRRDNDEAIGLAGIREEAEGIWHESGICIATAHQQKGYGRQVVEALMKLVFEEKKGKKLIYSCLKENEPSRQLALGCGLKYLNEEKVFWEKDGSERIIENYRLTAEEYDQERGDRHGGRKEL